MGESIWPQPKLNKLLLSTMTLFLVASLFALIQITGLSIFGTSSKLQLEALQEGQISHVWKSSLKISKISNFIFKRRETMKRKKQLPQNFVDIKNTTCIPNLLSSLQATCDKTFDQNIPTIEEIFTGVIILNQFTGTLQANKVSHQLNGTFLVKFENDTVKINNENRGTLRTRNCVNANTSSIHRTDTTSQVQRTTIFLTIGDNCFYRRRS